MSVKINKYLIVFLISLYPIHYSYNLDWPQSLSTKLQQIPYSYSLQKINLLYTCMSIGVILFIFKMGAIYDKYQLRYSIFIIPVLLCIIQFCITLLFYFYHSWNYYIILVMRMFFGIIGQSHFMLQTIFLMKIFKNQARPYIGFALSVGLLGSPLNSFFTPLFYGVFDIISFPLLIGCAIGLLDILIGMYFSAFLKKYQESKKLKLLQNQIESPLKSRPKMSLSLWEQIKSFSNQFWILWILVFIQTAAGAGFISIGVDLLVKRFGIPYINAGRLMLLPYSCGFLSSLIWIKITMKTRNVFILIPVLTIINYLALFFLPNTNQPNLMYYIIIPIILIIIGFIYGGYMLKIIPVVYLTSKPQSAGATVGFVAIAIHTVYVLIPQLSSLIVQTFKDQNEGYKYISFFYIGLGISSLSITIFIKFSKRFEKYQNYKNEELQNAT